MIIKKTFRFFSLFGILLLLLAAKRKTVVHDIKEAPFEIIINTLDSSLQVNGSFLNNYNMNDLEKIIGKPTRVKTHSFKSYYEEFGAEKMARTVVPITVTDYYYIYDKLGIMFYTNNGMSTTKQPQKFSIHFKNKRTFTNTAALPYSPANFFNGVLKINGDTLLADKKLISKETDYKTEDIQLFKTSFGSTSIATVIDGLYTKNTLPYVLLYLDTEKDQRISYVVVK